MFAVAEAAETHHAAAVVDGFVVDVDTVGLAVVLTLVAAAAFLAVDADAEEWALAEETQQGAHGADGVAPEASPEEAADEDDGQGDNGDDEWQSRGKEACCHAGEGTVGVDDAGDAIGDAEGAQHYQGHEESQHGVAQPVERTLVMELAAEDDAVEPGEEVLQDAKGTNHRAVDAAKEYGDQHDGNDDNDIQRHDGG